MLAKWVEILPLFIVRILAKRMCERVNYGHSGKLNSVFVTARPDVLFKE